MPFSVLVSLSIQKVIDELLKKSPKALAKCAELEDKVIQFDVQGFDTTLYFLVTHQGLEVMTWFDGEVDVTFTGYPSGYIALSKNPNDALFNNDITVQGNFNVGKQFSHLIDLIEVDIADFAAQYIGQDLADHFLSKEQRSAYKQKQDLRHQRIRNLLQDKLKVMPTKNEVSDFADKVHEVHLGVERMEQRIERLLRNRKAEKA